MAILRTLRTLLMAALWALAEAGKKKAKKEPVVEEPAVSHHHLAWAAWFATVGAIVIGLYLHKPKPEVEPAEAKKAPSLKETKKAPSPKEDEPPEMNKAPSAKSEWELRVDRGSTFNVTGAR